MLVECLFIELSILDIYSVIPKVENINGISTILERRTAFYLPFCIVKMIASTLVGILK